MIIGGGQQHGRRAGTLAVELIGGFAAAVKSGFSEADLLALTKIRSYARENLLRELSEAQVNSVNSVAHILSFSIPGRSTRDLVRRLSELGVAVSAGAACGSQGDSASSVLLALGRERKDAHHIRISFSPQTVETDIDQFFSALKIALNE